jgi:hypothetical protein
MHMIDFIILKGNFKAKGVTQDRKANRRDHKFML